MNIAKLPSVPRQIMKDSHGRQWKALKSKTLSEKSEFKSGAYNTR